MRKRIILSTLILTLLVTATETLVAAGDDGSIRPCSNNPWYWEYKGQPIMLIGASDRDNLWQWTGDRLITISSGFGHSFYNIANESGLGVEWDNYWAEYIKNAAALNGRDIYVNTMLFAPGNSVRRVMTYRNIYSFAEVSQNNQDALGPVGKKHWENLLFWRKMIAMSAEDPMPINNVKVYGQGVGLNTAAGTEKEAVERFWRNIFGGAASTRFHRPAMRAGGTWGWGIGINERARQTLRAVNMFLNEFDIFSAEPYEAIEMVGNSVDSYCLAIMGKAYALYFPGGRATVHSGS